jgi:hypothetical protein
MARYRFQAVGAPNPISVELDLDAAPPHDLPQLLLLRRVAADLLREDPRFEHVSRVHVHHVDGEDPEERLARVDRAYLQPRADADADRIASAA